KQHIDLRQRKRADRAYAREPGRAVQPAFERNRDLLLDLLGGEAGHLRGDLNRDRAEKGVCVDRQLRPRVDAENAGKYCDQPDYETLSETESDELINH